MSGHERNDTFLQLPTEVHCAAGDQTVGVGLDLNAVAILDQALQFGVEHVVQRSSMAFDQELVTARRMQDQVENFFRNPLASILSLENPTPSEEKTLTRFFMEFTSAYQRDELIAQLRAQMDGQINKDLLSDVLLIADELFSNAAHHAPLNIGPISEMRRKVHMLKGARLKPGQVKVGVDHERVVISCLDQYGSLDAREYLKQVRELISSGMHVTLTSGSGVGNYMVYMASVSLYVAVVNGQGTMICAAMPLKGGRIKRSQMAKNLHIMQRDHPTTILGDEP
jgi:hypothetical protein